MYHGHDLDSILQTRVRRHPSGGAPKTTTPNSARSRHRPPLTDEELWASDINDGGKAALAVTRGLTITESIPDPVVYAAMLLDPEKLAPDLASWKKEFNRTMPRLAQAYSTHRPDIADGVALVTSFSGYECRVQIDKMVQMIFSADRILPAAVYCIMMLLWHTHPKSKKRDMVSLVVEASRRGRSSPGSC